MIIHADAVMKMMAVVRGLQAVCQQITKKTDAVIMRIINNNEIRRGEFLPFLLNLYELIVKWKKLRYNTE